MNGYQPPLVPQSAVTFGDERLVDPWAETMLRNTCSNFQVQNMALQQENAALKTKNQSLQQQRANSIFKVADRAYLREFSAYRTEHFVKFPDERYYLVRENGFGAPYEVTNPYRTAQNSPLDMCLTRETAQHLLKSSTVFQMESCLALVFPLKNFRKAL